MANDVALCMIVKDEPIDRLALLIEYVRPLVSKVVIADTGSETDETELYRSWGVDAYNFQWVDDFSAARNSTLDRVPDMCEWILHLDADELPSWTMMQHMLWIRDNAPDHVKAYQFFTRNFWGTEWGIEHPAHWHVRMFRRAHGRWYKPLHEQVMIDGRQEEQAGHMIERANKDAYLIHAKPRETLDKSAILYSRMENK